MYKSIFSLNLKGLHYSLHLLYDRLETNTANHFFFEIGQFESPYC